MPSGAGPASCAVCGATRTLTRHHIHPHDFRESYPNGTENINERSNLVVLCAGCHAAVHDKRPFDKINKDLKTKLRRKIKDKQITDPERQHQSQKDLAVQRISWENLVKTLKDPTCCEMIESYRRIIRLVAIIHRAKFGGNPETSELLRERRREIMKD